MLVELTVENIAIIERSQIALGGGFTVLTGETGAGKSLLVDAIELALGERADSDLVRTGAAKASVSVAADLTGREELAAKCRELGIELDEGCLFIHREILVEGRSQCRVNGKLTPVSALKQLGQHLVDLHGQHDHQSLLDPGRHIGFLDAWIGPPASVLLEQTARAYEAAYAARQSLAALRAGLRDREHRLDLLRFQVGEIESIDPKPGEMEELEAQLSRLKNVERIMDATSLALAGLRGGDTNAADLLRASVKALEEASRFDPAVEGPLDTLRSALIQLEEGTHDLSAYAESVEADPALLEEVAGRIDSLRRLRRKYGEDESGVLAFLEQARRELDLLSDAEASEEDLVARLEEAESELRLVAEELSSLRHERAIEFAERVQHQLRDLAMERAEFEVSFRRKEPDASGQDEVEFFFSANPGEPPRPLSRIASGGEVSRVMLAIKTATAGRAGVPTLIFDEVDAGLGGKAAATVARKLEELAQHYQVLVISHLPQIAARAATHFRIEKVESGGRIKTQVRLLDPDERVTEVARMLAGEQVTDSALANAREMLGLPGSRTSVHTSLPGL
ncbi:MAG TPA: DNA repair protein RecN [Fimbriimonadaceae bacterium]|nr:DNA repair protein RecN [Fimbriimonadaceae bacterium]